jgi:hypothetical protein
MRKKFKTTFSTDKMSKKASSSRVSKNTYAIYDDVKKKAFSKQKLKYGSLDSNPILKRPPFGKKGKIKFKKGSVLYSITDHRHYDKVEGKSLDHIEFDETNPYSPFIKINIIKSCLRNAKAFVHSNQYKYALDEIEDALKVFKHLEISLKHRRKK